MEIYKSPQLAEVSLKYRTKVPPSQMPQVTSPQEAVELLRKIWDEDTLELQEEFLVLLLNNAKKCLGWAKISQGSATSTIVDPGAILRIALVANATSILLAHNHPSGNLEASKADIELTNRIEKSGKLLGLTIDDHIILTSENHTSFRQKGLIG